MTTSTPYTRLQLHLAENMYKKGANKDSAPLDASRRNKCDNLVIDRGDRMVVRRFKTDIISVYPEGKIVLDGGGWDNAPTTREAMNIGLRLCGFYIGICSGGLSSLRTTVLGNRQGTVKFYDNMVLDFEGNVTSPLLAFEKRQINKQDTAEFHAAIKASGFKDLFPFLWETAEAEEYMRLDRCCSEKELVASAEHVGVWPALVNNYARIGTFHARKKAGKKETWDAIMKESKRRMYEVVPTDVFTI